MSRPPTPRFSSQRQIEAIRRRWTSAPPASDAPGDDVRLSATRAETTIHADTAPVSQPRSVFQGVKRELEVDACTELHRPLTQMPALTASSHSVGAQASEFIQVELNQSKDLLRNRRTILEAALEFVNLVSHRSNETAIVEEAACVGSPSPLPPFSSETLVLLIREMTSRPAGANKTQFPDHILPKTLERMGAAIVNGTVSGQTLMEYQICVYFKTFILFSMWDPQKDGNPLKQHIKTSRDRYRNIMSQALNNISVMAQPTFGLCQALAIFTQLIGDASRSWNLIAFASRILVALGYHKPGNSAGLPRTDEEYEIHGCIFWCFLMDRLLSMHLGRPPSLPSLEVNRAWLSHPDFPPPLVAIADLLGDFACIQDAVLNWRESSPRIRRQDGIAANMSISAIQQRMSSMSAKIDKIRQAIPVESEAPYMISLLEFPYYSLDTAILRLSPYVASNPDTRQRCLASARNALVALSTLQEWELHNEEPSADEDYPTFLAWTIHAYPLCPFFVVFCNVVSTSSAQDFQMIQRVTDGFARYASGNKAVGRLHYLFSKLVALCRPLFQPPGNTSSMLQTSRTQGSFELQQFRNTMNRKSSESFALHTGPLENVAVPQQYYPLNTYAANGSSVPRTGTSFTEFSINTSSLWAEDTMMGLFNYEPSLSWLNGV
ncbi:hypothetical protein G7Z17_g10197 [Cylindrodendrum hubeiense]|uniref:Xylanolytic transcriptional activator regulatory domain-containing protein n=1 Tax=Cylindrodendrum hubeiense TaxID=595255 RepID=A0A9P5H7M3_9HYPO|nr:hypothetical protein G7Z17_g10197 [Cylindrodendrum hubeiense]